MFDNKLYYQLNKIRVREYQNNYYNTNAKKWREYHSKYRSQNKKLKHDTNIMKTIFLLWKKYINPCCLKVIKGPFII